MGVTPDQLLQLASELLDDEADEVKIRASASRSYYGAFHICRKIAETRLPPVPPLEGGRTEGSHQKVIRAFTRHLEPGEPEERRTRIREVGQLLLQCLARRKTADYEIEDKYLQDHAAQNITAAATIRQMLSDLGLII